AYGIAVTLTMVITTLLLHAVATQRWKWPAGVAAVVTGAFLGIDLAFFGANLLKVLHGGWLPLVIGGALFALMTTWKTGRQMLAQRLAARAVPLEQFVQAALAKDPIRVPGTAVFMTAQTEGAPAALVHNLRHNRVLHDRVIILTVQTTRTPHVAPEDRLSVRPMGRELYNAVLRYGFMDEPNVPEALALAAQNGLLSDAGDVTYFLGRETVIVTKTPGMALWRERLFVVMAKNAVRATAFFKLPPDAVVELGVQVEI
ncbi:MAG: potassium transporter Kup, partial [Luteitalea sp.]|nr:potassium transporter Kup [Luteitalea sp.]